MKVDCESVLSDLDSDSQQQYQVVFWPLRRVMPLESTIRRRRKPLKGRAGKRYAQSRALGLGGGGGGGRTVRRSLPKSVVWFKQQVT